MSSVRVEDHRNNLDALRVFAALMVIHGHGWVLAGAGGSGLWSVPFGRVGLDVFFSISGYLVTASWGRSPRLPSFLAKRALRIFPGLIACVLLTVVVLGPLMTTLLTLRDYAAAPETARYLGNIALLNELFLPGVFTGLRERGAVNGSLWSLLPEFVCYLTVPLFALVAARWRVAALAVAAILCGGAGLAMFYGEAGPRIVYLYHLDLRYALVEVPFFLIGAALRRLDQRFGDRLWRADLCLIFFSLNYLISAYLGWWNIPFEWFTLPYMVLAFGRMAMPVIRRAARFGDLSYGLYLYAFPVQQAVLALWPGANDPVLLCAALTVPLALFSWHVIERPALRWRRPLDRSTRPEQAAEPARG